MFLITDKGKILLEVYRRIANIVRIEQRKDSCSFFEVSPSFLRSEEKELWATLNNTKAKLGDILKEENYSNAFQVLAELREPIDKFFNEVMINVDNKNIRTNRLGILQQAILLNHEVADLSKIEGGSVSN